MPESRFRATNESASPLGRSPLRVSSTRIVTAWKVFPLVTLSCVTPRTTPRTINSESATNHSSVRSGCGIARDRAHAGAATAATMPLITSNRVKPPMWCWKLGPRGSSQGPSLRESGAALDPWRSSYAPAWELTRPWGTRSQARSPGRGHGWIRVAAGLAGRLGDRAHGGGFGTALGRGGVGGDAGLAGAGPHRGVCLWRGRGFGRGGRIGGFGLRCSFESVHGRPQSETGN